MEKLIGVFTEHDGVETETLPEMIERFGIIGSSSADIGGIELYYDNKGTTYVIVHDSEKYYGKKDTNKKYMFITKSGATLNENNIDNVITQILLSEKCNGSHEFIEFMKPICDNCDLIQNIKNMSENGKIRLLKKYGYTIYEIK